MQVIELLNRYFVPVSSANELGDRERIRIYQDFIDKKLGAGDVHCYVVDANGKSIASLGVGVAIEPGKMEEFLKRMIEQLHPTAGPPVFAPHPQMPAPRVEPGVPAIHLVARRPEHGTWAEFPSENWIVLSRDEWDQILPPQGAALKTTWQVPAPIAAKLAEWLYPQAEDTKRKNRSRVEMADFRLTLVTLEGTLARARIEGRTNVFHSFNTGRISQDYATAELIGYADFDLAAHQVQRFRMVVKKGDYRGMPFECSLHSVSAETIEAQR